MGLDPNRRGFVEEHRTRADFLACGLTVADYWAYAQGTPARRTTMLTRLRYARLNRKTELRARRKAGVR